MFVGRGVLPSSHLHSVVTFGAPTVLSEGPGSCSCGAAGTQGMGGGVQSPTDDLLTRMGVPDSSIKNVVMHRDIVPRSFACQSPFLADLLRRVGGTFRSHCCLENKKVRRASLRSPLGFRVLGFENLQMVGHLP